MAYFEVNKNFTSFHQNLGLARERPRVEKTRNVVWGHIINNQGYPDKGWIFPLGVKDHLPIVIVHWIPLLFQANWLDSWEQSPCQMFLYDPPLSLGLCLRNVTGVTCSMTLAYKNCHYLFSCSVSIKASCSLSSRLDWNLALFSWGSITPICSQTIQEPWVWLTCCKQKVFSPRMERALLSAHCSRLPSLHVGGPQHGDSSSASPLSPVYTTSPCYDNGFLGYAAVCWLVSQHSKCHSTR